MEIPETLKQIGAVVAFIFLAITGVLLIMDLGRPDRFLNVLFRPQWKSWLSRGAYIITAYGAILTLWLVASFLGFENLIEIHRAFRNRFRAAFGSLHGVSFRAGERTRFLAKPDARTAYADSFADGGLRRVFLDCALFVEIKEGFRMVLTFLTIVDIDFPSDNFSHRTDDHAHDRRRARDRQNDYRRRIPPRLLVRNDFRRQHFALILIFAGQIAAFALTRSFDFDLDSGLPKISGSKRRREFRLADFKKFFKQ